MKYTETNNVTFPSFNEIFTGGSSVSDDAIQNMKVIITLISTYWINTVFFLKKKGWRDARNIFQKFQIDLAMESRIIAGLQSRTEI